MKKWVSINAKHFTSYDKDSINENLQEFKQFKKDSARTISYLVKEFEMKKSADGYKRSTTDKTGIIDPLKLHKYKISEDIFKRLSIIPDAKNHGMILLLDWSGSMCNVIDKAPLNNYYNLFGSYKELVFLIKYTSFQTKLLWVIGMREEVTPIRIEIKCGTSNQVILNLMFSI